MITKFTLQRVAVSTVGALLLSGASILAVTPAQAEHAAAPLTLADWRAVVEERIDQALRMPSHAAPKAMSAVTVRIRFDDEGAYSAARITQSSGDPALDREALRTAANIRYPSFPEGLRGRAQTVEMKLFFGSSAGEVSAARQVAQGQARAAARSIASAQIAATSSR